jgi:hypothetical protein
MKKDGFLVVMLGMVMMLIVIGCGDGTGNGDGTVWTQEGALTVTNIPSQYINAGFRIAVTGNTVGGGDGSGRVSGGSNLSESIITTVPITAQTTTIPLFWRSGFTDVTLQITVYITSDVSYSLAGLGQPANITILKNYSPETFVDRSLTVSWN